MKKTNYNLDDIRAALETIREINCKTFDDEDDEGSMLHNACVIIAEYCGVSF